ncbi:glycosyltransferase [Roseateles asaccharophilus]|uniref:Glycosyltransferase involved in cell wall biosynthesis n=1 Tax=Roseateles asaccharophilus TaxID=582607 RepID=A0ABU2A426_9BURK|nr:glycosyltransferase [Roseateles asaccharophilus]MDR7331272.1 glycosyltransferase involved in cell wall biosynthesis [Roseateles asaccharophilus]
MRIGYVAETLPPDVLGDSPSADQRLRHLRSAGHAVQLIRPRRPGEPPRRDADEWCCGLTTPGALRSLWRDARMRPDIVHVATPGPLGWAALRAAHAEGIPASADFRIRASGPGWLRAALLSYLRRLHAMAAGSFVATAELARELDARGFERLFVLGRGVDTRLFSPTRRDAALREHWRASAAERVLLYVGPLTEEHNAGVALQMFARLGARRPGLRRVVVGDGPLRARLEREHPGVRFAGSLAGHALARHYASADVLLFPSLDDGCSHVVLEAQASGLAVAAFDRGAAARHVRDGVNGCLAATCDGLAGLEAFFDAATRALEASAPDGPLRTQARLAGCQADWGDVLRRFEQQLEQLAHARPAAA